MGIINYFTFVITAFIFIITPGIDTMFILNKSIVQGRKAGIYSTLGLNTGVIAHTLFAALGLSLLVARSAMAFELIKYAGAAYLLYLGLAKLISKDNVIQSNADSAVPALSSKQNYISGFVTNILNPKVALFFLAFFPQFIKPELINTPVPFLILGITCAIMGSLWFFMLTFFAAYFSKSLTEHPGSGFWLNKLSGAAFIMMGIKIAFTKR